MLPFHHVYQPEVARQLYRSSVCLYCEGTNSAQSPCLTRSYIHESMQHVPGQCNWTRNEPRRLLTACPPTQSRCGHGAELDEPTIRTNLLLSSSEKNTLLTSLLEPASSFLFTINHVPHGRDINTGNGGVGSVTDQSPITIRPGKVHWQTRSTSTSRLTRLRPPALSRQGTWNRHYHLHHSNHHHQAFPPTWPYFIPDPYRREPNSLPLHSRLFIRSPKTSPMPALLEPPALLRQ